MLASSLVKNLLERDRGEVVEGWPSARENVRAAPSVMRGLRREGTKNLQISGPYSIETEAGGW